MRGRQGELKYRTARFIALRPEPAAVGTDDRPADGQPHPGSVGLCGVECFEYTLEMIGINARPGIAHGHEDAIRLSSFGADQQCFSSHLNGAHCFRGIQDQVQEHLLQFNTIPPNGRGARPSTGQLLPAGARARANVANRPTRRAIKQAHAIAVIANETAAASDPHEAGDARTPV
jgi:hypothetical protein